MVERPAVLSGRFTKEEAKIIEQQAEKEGVTVAEYVRVAVMTGLVLDGNVEAMKLLAANVRSKLGKRFAWADALRRTPGLRKVKAE